MTPGEETQGPIRDVRSGAAGLLLDSNKGPGLSRSSPPRCVFRVPVVNWPRHLPLFPLPKPPRRLAQATEGQTQPRTHQTPGASAGRQVHAKPWSGAGSNMPETATPTEAWGRPPTPWSPGRGGRQKPSARVPPRHHEHLCTGAHDRSADPQGGTQALKTVQLQRAPVCTSREAWPRAP